MPLNVAHFIQVSYFYLGILCTLSYFFISPEMLIISFLVAYILTHASSIFYHRLISHSSFKVNRFINYIGTTLCCLHNSGSPFTWRYIHFAHHRFADKEGDPHSPKFVGHDIFKHMALTSSNDSIHHKAEIKCLRNIDNYHVFLHNYGHYIKIIFSLSLLFLFGFDFFVIYHIAPIIFNTFNVSLVNMLGHTKLKYSFRSDNNSKNYAFNNFFLALFLSAGEGWHDNHHKSPSNPNMGKKWWQIDTSYYIIKLLGGK